MSNIKTFEDLYNFLITSNLTFDNFIKDNWEGKEKQESLFRLFCYLNIPKNFPNYCIAVGNYDKQTITKCKVVSKLMKNNLKDKGDKSDLTFIHKKDNKKLIVTTSKSSKKYNIGKLDIEKIYNIFNEDYKSKEYKIHLCIVIPDKKYYYNMLNNIESNNKKLYKRCKKATVIDHNDLRIWYNLFMKNFKNISIKDLYDINNPKSSMNLYFHQKLSINKFVKLYNTQNNILLGCIPRSGKSFIMAGIIDYYKDKGQCQNYLILTTCPNETINQYLDIFENSIEFDSFNIYHLQKTTKPKGFNVDKKNIIICSEQFLKYKNKSGNGIRNIKFLKDLQIHIRFIDEAHHGGTTELSDKIMDKYGNGSKVCFITATYTKPKVKFNIDPKSSILWDLEDVQLCKNIKNPDSMNRFLNKHSQIVEEKDICEIINSYTHDRIIKEYSIYPELHLLTLSFDKDIESEIIKETKDSKYGWSTESIFLLKQNNKEIIEEFQNPEGVRKLCYNIFGKMGKYAPEKEYENCILNRIENIVKNPQFNSRWFDAKNPLTILCFLPCGNQSIDKLSNTFKKLLEDENIIKDFEIGIINSKQSYGPLQIIRDTRNIAKNKNKKGVLILSGRQCSLGVSIHSCDIVLMLNNTSSMDQYLQMGFRSMTEAPHKKCGFIIDLNIQRVGNMLVEQAIKMYPSMSINKSIKKILRQRLINLNVDEWMDEYFGVSQTNLSHISRTLFNIYNYSPAGNIKNILDNLNFKYDIFSKKDQKLINTLFKISKLPKSKRLQKEKTLTKEVANKLFDKMLQSSEVKNGVEEISVHNEEEKKEDEKDNKKSKDINFVRDIIKHVIPLISLLTIHEENKSSMEEMINNINQIPDLKHILIQQIRTWWGTHISEKVLEVFIVLYKRYLQDIENFDNIINIIKEIFHINLNDKNKLSQLIDQYLLPHEIEIKNNAEIPTPYNLRQDMINLMVKYGDKDFWKSTKKVLEPTCGKGGFLLDIVDRFMNGLTYIEDPKERYRVIVEECLYFADINPQNIYICKLLLDPYSQYKLNYYLGDSLQYNPDFKFDLVIGNPPYNNKKSNTENGYKICLYDIFTKKYIKLTNRLIFIIPARWFSSSGKIEKFRHTMLNRKDIRMIKYFPNSKDIFKNVDIKGGICYFYIDNSYKGLCNFNETKINLNKYDILIDSKYHSIIEKVKIYSKFDEIYRSKGYFGISLTNKNLKETQNNNDIVVYMSKQKGFIKYINKKYIKKDISKWKVITPSASYAGGSGFGNIFIGNTNEVYSESYIGFEINTELEAKSLLSYLKCKTTNFLLSLRKNTQNISLKTIQFIPFVPLDRKWDDEQLYEYFNFTKEEVKLIKESNIKGSHL